MSSKRFAFLASDGCSVLLLTGAASCIMLIINALVVRELYGVFAQIGPGFLRHDRVEQVATFFAPILLIFVEWWIVDWWTDRWHQKRREQDAETRG